MNDKLLKITQRQLIGLMVLLTIEFVLGITLTTIINFNPSSRSAAQNGVLIAHVIVAIGIIIGGIARLVVALKWKYLRKLSALGLVAALGAFVSGSIASSKGNKYAVFSMALCFIIAFMAYGYSLSKIRATALSK